MECYCIKIMFLLLLCIVLLNVCYFVVDCMCEDCVMGVDIV